jgi:hypothetical protein
MRKIVVLTPDEIAELSRQAPETASGGGFQSLSVRLQKKVNHSTQELILNDLGSQGDSPLRVRLQEWRLRNRSRNDFRANTWPAARPLTVF